MNRTGAADPTTGVRADCLHSSHFVKSPTPTNPALKLINEISFYGYTREQFVSIKILDSSCEREERLVD